MAQSNLSPVDYTWMDLTNYHVSGDAWMAVVEELGGLNTTPIKDHPLPFESLAILTESPLAFNLNKNSTNIESITRNTDGSAISLVTIVREKNVINYVLHFYIGKDDDAPPAVVGKVTDDVIDNDPKKRKSMTFVLNKKFDRLLKAHGFDPYNSANAIFGDHCLSVMRKLYTLTVKPDPAIPVGRPYGDIAKNAKRRKKGKTQFWEWKTIELKSTRTLPSAPLGGTHASPKPHERMGHWRAYKSGKRIFVKPHIVNKHKIPEEGYIFHDYTTRH